MTIGKKTTASARPRRSTRSKRAIIAHKSAARASRSPIHGWLNAAAAGLLIGLSAGLADHWRRNAAKGGDENPPLTASPLHKPLATSPWRLSVAQWRDVLVCTANDFNNDQIAAVAAGVTFFGLLALFPALSAFVSLYGLFADVGEAQKQISVLEGVLPSGGVSVLTDQMTRLVKTDHGKLGMTFLISLLLSIWSANAGVKALMAGLNAAFEKREGRKFFALNLISLVFTLGFTAFTVIAISAVVAVPPLLQRIGLGALSALSVLRWPLILVVVVGLLSILYRYGPSRSNGRWRWITPGAVAAGLGWLAMSLLFSWYVAHFGSYDKTYGSLGAVVGSMTWIWPSAIVVLFGAELNSELEKHTTAPIMGAR